ncbi:MAG: leukotoxin LktA family filamentous adhesin [Bradyrhizobium sp.]|nr:leukotoxin LktA family filamentous adhesin [Bradyrhizobium sp.]
MTLYPVLSFAQGGTVITPDGRTATSVTTNGNVSTVTTGTVSGPNAFNSFSQFRIGGGATGNLILPNGTSNLINLMNSNDPAVINGVLNSYKNGAIGGNVYFASPGGFVVGSRGVVNVGSLNVTTPTREFVDGVISRSGKINQGAVGDLLAGTVPLSQDGNIRIRGRVNAVDAVRLTGQNVFVGDRGVANRQHAAHFASTVNSGGLRSASGIVVRNGHIQIVAGTDARIYGRLAARGGGSVKIAAGHNVSVGSNARITADSKNGIGGTITVDAARDARINGRLAARGGGSVKIAAGRNVSVGPNATITADNKNGNGGTIAVNAGQDIKIAGFGKLSAKSATGNGGSVRLMAGKSLTVESGAVFDASSVRGNAGLVELSSYDKFNLASGIKVNVGAPNGQAGVLLIDPPTLVVGAAGESGVNLTNAQVANLVSALGAGGTLSLCAGGGSTCDGTGTFTLNQSGVIDSRLNSGSAASANVEIKASSITINGVIDTRAYTGALVDGLLSASNKLSNANSGSVTLNASPNNFANTSITIGSTGKIFADVNNATGTSATFYTGGAVIMTAGAKHYEEVLPSNAVTSISIAGQITGSTVSATANSDASTVFTNSGLGMAQFGTGLLFHALTGLNGGYVKSEAQAKVTVEGTANITASGAVTLASVGSEVAQDPVITFSLGALQNAVAAGVVVGVVNADVATRVKSGAQISSGDLNVLSANNADLAVASLVFTATTAADGSVAYSTGTVNTSATIDPGVVISKVANVTVAAQNKSSFSTSATALAGGTGSAAVAIAVSDVHNNAVANLGASIPSTASANAITVYSGSNTTKNAVSASSTVGSPYLVRNVLQGVSGASTTVSGLFQPGGFFEGTRLYNSTEAQGTTASLRVGLTLALNQASLTSTASIAALAPNAQGVMVASGPAPVITASGGVGVVSLLRDAGIRGNAGASIESNPQGTAADPTTQKGISMAVNVTEITQSSNAFIGSGVSITASKIGVKADSTSPITITWQDWDSFSAVTSHLNGNLGVVNDILTTYANATAESESFGFAGAVNYYNLTTNTTAWVGSGAILSQIGTPCLTSATTCWSSTPAVTLPSPASNNLDWFGTPTTISWAHDVEVQAATTTSSINVGGNFSWLTVFGTKSSSSTGTAIGGSANVNIFNSSTVAGIGAGARVTATGALEVSAATKDLIYAVAPTSGKGSGLGLNGIASVLQLDNTTSASISNSAVVSASSVTVAGQQEISSFDVAGGVGASKATGVGLVVALASMSAHTFAYIGDNSSALTATGATADDSNLAVTSAGWVSAFTINVDALSVGRLTTVSVAAESANNTPDPADTPAKAATKPSGDGYLAKIGAFFKNAGTAVLAKLDNAYNNLKGTVSGPVQGGNVTAAAGSAAVDLTSIATSASVAGATLKYTPGGNNSVSVQALNNTIIDTASGAAALSKGAPGTNNTVGLAGAVAVTISSDMTTANISSGSNVTAHDTTVQALAGGESTTLGLAIALTAGSGDGKQASASVSVAEINNGVQAGVDSSTVGQAAGGSGTPGNLSIIADQKTNIGIGAGSLYGGFGSGSKNGFGVSMTYAKIGDPSSGAAVSAVLSNSYVLNTRALAVEALDTSRIASGAATAGGGANANGFSGSVVVNDISPTILAEITSIPAVSGTALLSGGITVSGDVIVVASGGSNATLDAIISNAAIATNGGLVGPTSDSGVDFSGTALSPTNTTGAAILAVAGNVQIGRSNVGVSIVANRIGTRHEALVDRVSVTSTGGVVSVSALDDAEILGIAIGVGGATGAVAGNGSVAYNAINNRVIAQIGHGTDSSDAANTAAATVDAAAVLVKAQDTATIRGAAGAISLNVGGGNAVGLSATVDQISTFVSAAVAGATVTADNTLSNSSPLITGSLQAGSVVVAGSSNANIISVAIGVAIAVGSSEPSASPQANFASLVAGLAPPAPSSQSDSGGGGVTPPTPPAPPAAPSPPSTGLAGAGSLAMSTEATSVYATIDHGANGRNASVGANDNVLVLASNVDTISAYAGALSVAVNAGKGIGASVVVNTISGTTSAGINNATVDAHGTGNAATISNGTLASAVDPSAVYDPGSNPSLASGTTTVKGIAVVAASEQTVNTVSAVFSASTSGLAVSANVITNVMSGTTEATTKSASLNTNLTSGQTSAVQVTAYSASYANNLDIGIADSGSGGAGTVTLVINMMNRTTTASIDTTDIGSQTGPNGAVGVFANAFQGTSGVAVGAAGSGGGAGLAGSALTNLFQSNTTASLNHGTIYSSGLAVKANGLNGFFAAIGAGALGSSAGAGATVLVNISNNTVKALVGDNSTTPTVTTLHLTGALTVQATNETKTTSYAIVGAVGGTAGIAAQFSGVIITNTTDAELDNTSVTNTAGAAANIAVTVSATENDSIAPVVGGVAGGGTAGVGAGVSLVILKNTTKALMAGDTVNTSGVVTVSALSNREVNPITAIAGLGGQVGIAGTVGVVLIGSAASSDELSVLNSGATQGDASSGTLGNAGAATGTNVVAATGSGEDGISAQIIGGSVTAGQIDINAKSQASVKNIVGALAVGLGTGGFGAAVGYTEVDQKVTARASGGSLTASTISIVASAGDHNGGHSAESWGIAGAGGLYVGIGAAVGQSKINNTVLAELGSTTDGGTTGASSGTILVNAGDTSSIASYGYGFGGGAAAVGLSLAFADKSSSVTADIAGSTGVTRFASVMVTAGGSGSVASQAIAGAAGVVSGAGASATSTDSEHIKAEIGSDSSVSAAGAGVLVAATAVPDVSAKSYGVAVGGGVGMGASVALSSADVTVTADVGDNSTISNGSLTIAASALVGSSGHSANSYAVGAGGGMLLGLQATYVKASDGSNVTAYGGKNLHLPSANVAIASENDTNQLATATGIAVGYIGLGATVAETSSNSHSIAYLDAGAITAAANLGVLSITATGSDSNSSNATAGSGGIFAGSAAVATTSTTSTTTATLYGGATIDTLYFGGLGVNAWHTTTYSANGDAFQASVVGASGGQAINTVLDTATAEVGSNLILNSAAGNMNVIASDSVFEFSGGSRAGSGGIAAGAATLSSATVTQNVTSHIGSGTIFSLNDNPATSTASIDIEAYNFLQTTDTVSLDAGGLFAGGGARSTMSATATDTVTIDDNVTLFSAGNIAIGTAARMTANNRANASLYGLITGAGASTNAAQKVTQNVTIGNSKVEAWGLIGIYAGQSGDGNYTSNISSNGTTVVYNNALIPISAEYKGESSAESYSTLTLSTGSQVIGANNVFLGSTPGAVASNGKGTNYNPYLSLFSTENHDDAGAAPITTGNLIINGTVAAGIHNQANITIGYNDSVALSSGGSPYALALEQLSSTSQFSPIMSYNHQKIQYAVVNGFNPKQDVVDQIASLSGLNSTQVRDAVVAGQQIAAQNDDSAGTKQRQINTLIQEIAYMSDNAGAAFAFGSILASAGNVSILAKSLSGSIVNGVTPSVSARDSAKVSFDNQGTKFLFLSDLALSGVAGGRVDFTGQATDTTVVHSASQGINFTRDLSSQPPTISVSASYNATNVNREPIDQNGNVLATTPDIYLGGTVTNVNGLLSVTNQLGNVLITRDIRAGTVAMTVPNGMIGGNSGANSVYNSNFDVASQWSSVEYRPTDILTAVEAAATYLGTYGGAYVDGQPYAHPYYYYTSEGSNPIYAPVNSSGYGDPSAVFTARLLALFYGGGSLYSALFLPVGGGYTTGARVSGWERDWYRGQAYNGGDSGPIHCHGCGDFFQIVDLQNQVLNGVTAAATATSTMSTITAGKALILSASAININGNISVGQSSDYSVNIGTSAVNKINDIKNDASQLATARSKAASGQFVDLAPYISTVNGSDTKIVARYNALTDQILLDPVVQGAGGYVYLNGRIISTSASGNPMGNITVHGGAGTVTVNNSTGVALVTNVINTGVSAASVIEFVDQAKNQTTWYVYNAGAPANQQVSVYQQAGVNSSGYTSLSPVNVMANANLHYQPADQLYRWIDSASLSRPDTADSAVFGWTFTGVSANAPIYPYNRSAPIVLAGTQNTNFSETIAATGSYIMHVVDTSPHKCCGTDFNGNWYQERYNQLSLTMTNTVKANYAIGISFTGGGTSNIAVTSDASIIVNASINNLQGNTTLNATGANASITGGAAPFVSGISVALNAVGGVGTLAAPLPIATFGGTLMATSIDHDIAIGASGSVTISQMKANPAVSGNAPAGSVFISATGDIRSASNFDPANPIIAGKSVTINTSGGAIGAASGVDGNGNATLTNINPIVIQATGTPLLNGSYDGGLLNSQSSAGAYIVQSTGDLRLGTISSTGPVFLEAAGSNGQPANILNGLTSGGLTADQTAYLQSVWSDLNLLGNGNGPPVSVVSYQSMITATYNDYWQMRNLAFVDGATYNISALGAKVIAAQLAAKLGVEASTITSQQIQTEATNRFNKDQYLLGLKTAAQLGVSKDALFGTSAGQTSNFEAAVATIALAQALTNFDSSFSYLLPQNSALYANMASGSRWTQDQLTYTVSAGANPEHNVAAPSITSLPLNISGRQVMLYAPSGTIGSLASPQAFSFTTDGSMPLTDLQKGLMAAAGPGQLTVTTSTFNGPNGAVTQYNVSIAQQSLVKVSPLGTVSAKARDQVYLGSASDLSLGGIPVATFGPVAAAYSAGVQTTTGGDVVLQAVGSILGGVAGQVAISGNIANLTLIAETGGIGRASVAGSNPAQNDNALLLALSGPVGNVDQLQAAHGIYLRQTTGDLVLGNINAGSGADGVLQLGATGSIYAESGFTARNAVHIVATALDLRAVGSVSFNQTTFQPLQVKISGAVTGSAGGQMTILSPNANLNVGQSGLFGTLTSGGAMTLETNAGNLTINANVTGTDALQLLANSAVIFASGTSGAPITAQSTAAGVTLASATLSMGMYSEIDAAASIVVSTTGNATLGKLQSTASSGTSISVTAGGASTAGAISGNGDGRSNISASGANADIALWASRDIGSGLVPISLDAATATANVTSTGGNVFLTALRDLHLTSGIATNGSFAISSAAALTLDSLVVGTTLNVRSTGATVYVGTATSVGTQTIQAAQNVTFGQLTTNGIAGDLGDVTVTSDNAAIQGATVAANGSATLTAATTNQGTTLTASVGSATLSAGDLIDWTTLNAGGRINVVSTNGAVTLGSATSGGAQNIEAKLGLVYTTLKTTAGDIDLTSHTASITGQAPGELDARGSFTAGAATTVSATSVRAETGSGLVTAGGAIGLGTSNTATTLGVRSTGAAVTLGSATSGDTQNFNAASNLAFTTLKTTGTGDIVATAGTGSIIGTTIDAARDVALAAGTAVGVTTLTAGRTASTTAGTTLTGQTFTASTGSASLNAGGLIDWTTLNAGTAIIVRSTGGAANLGTAASGGSQTIRAAQNVTFGQLTTSGIAGDQGDITVASDSALIHGTTVSAHNSALLTAATSNTGTLLTAATGDATLRAGGSINWTTVNAAKTFAATSTGGSVLIRTATSGGSQALVAFNDIIFDRLEATGIPTDRGGITLQAINGTVHGNTLIAHGDAGIDSKASITLNALQGDSVSLSTPKDIAVSQVNVFRSMTLAGDTINVTAKQLPSAPPVPLHVVMSGFNGGVATAANVTIDPPVVIVDQLKVVDIVLSVDSPALTIISGYVPGQMMLMTPAGDILLNNRTPAPVGSVNLQLYQPNGQFTMSQFGNANFTNTNVVWYDTTISSTITNYGGGDFTGASFVRNSLQDMRNGNGFDFGAISKSGNVTFYMLGLPGGQQIEANQIPRSVQVIGSGPAVNLRGLMGTGDVQKSEDEVRKTAPKSKTPARHIMGQFSNGSGQFGLGLAVTNR